MAEERIIQMYFTNLEQPSLWMSKVTLPQLGKTVCAVRGKWRGAYHNYGSFEWSRAVQGACMLLIHAHMRSKNPEKWAAPDLIGYESSYALSLDYALDKQPAWMAEIFGSDLSGLPFLRRMIDRTNPNRKRPGPVALTMNARIVEPRNIQIFLEGKIVDTEQDLEALFNALCQSSVKAEQLAA